jgi:FecR-like protein
LPRGSLLRIGALAAAAIALVALTWSVAKSPDPSWAVTRTAGTPSIDAEPVGATGAIRVGQWLETDADSEATLEVADIGTLQVAPLSRVRIKRTGEDEHRVELARGRIDASVDAPPRLFVVETPSATAVDLGCEYSLEVDEDGNGRLELTLGWVALEDGPRTAIVPEGAVCPMRAEFGPGTPRRAAASGEFLSSLDAFDAGDATILERILATAGDADGLSLWHLLARAEGDGRAAVYDRLAEFVPPPPLVTREGVLALDAAMLDAWWAEVEFTW